MNSSIFPLLTLFLAHLHSRPTHFRRPSILIHTPQFRRPSILIHAPHFQRPSIPIHAPHFRCLSILIHAPRTSPQFRRPSIPIHAPHFQRPSIPIHAPRTSPQTGLLYTKSPRMYLHIRGLPSKSISYLQQDNLLSERPAYYKKQHIRMACISR